MAAAQHQRDYEHGGDRLEALLQSQNVCRIWASAWLGEGDFRQRTARQRRWIGGAERGRSPSTGAAKGVDCLIYRAGCRGGCRLVADLVVVKMRAWIRQMPVKQSIVGEYLFSDNESNEISKENAKCKKRWTDDRLQVFQGLLPDFVVGSLCLAFLSDGGSLWEMKRK